MTTYDILILTFLFNNKITKKKGFVVFLFIQKTATPDFR